MQLMLCHCVVVVVDLVVAATAVVVVAVVLVVVVGSCGVIIDARVLWQKFATFRSSGRFVCCLY